MQLGISSWAFPWAIGWADPKPAAPMTVIGLLEKAKELGVSLVQIADNFPLDALSKSELLELKQTSKQWGICLEVGTRGIEPSHLRKFLKIALELDADLVRTLPGMPGKFCPEKSVMVSSIREVLKDFADTNVKLAIENHEPMRTDEFAMTVKEIDHPLVGITLDLANIIGALESPREAVANLAPHVLNLHIKEFKIVRGSGLMGLSVVGCPVGTGLLNPDWLIGQIVKAGRKPTAVIEAWPPFTETIEKTVALENEWAGQSIAYLKSLKWFSKPCELVGENTN